MTTFAAYTANALPQRRSMAFECPSRKIATLAIVLATLQVLDGLLTGVGVLHFGTHMEGNAILRVLMEQFGAIPALVIVKSMAIGVVWLLAMLSGVVSWLAHAFRAMIVLYTMMAIIPWSAILFTQL